MRDELLDTVARVGGRLGEMRLDTTVDVSHAVARFLELIKVAALIDRSEAGQALDEALAEVNSLLAQGATPEQREILAARRSTTGCATPSATRAPPAPRRSAGPSRRSTRSSRAAGMA